MAIQMYDLCARETDRRFSPYCWRIRMALAHKGLEVETIPWRFVEKDKLAFADSTTVPVLVDGANTVADSWKIALYLEEKYADRPSLFGHEAAIGSSLFVRQWTDRVLHLAILPIVLLDIYRLLDEPNQAYFRASREKRFGVTLEAYCANSDEHVKKLRNTIAPLRAVVAEQSFIGGTKPSYADYTVFGAFQWARCVSATKLLAEDDAVHAWRGRMLGLFGALASKAKGFEV